MDPLLKESASRYLGALLQQPPEQLQELASRLLNSGVLTWLGQHSFQLNRESPSLIAMCPALLSNETLSKFNTPDALRVLRARITADPDFAAIDSPGELSGGCFGVDTLALSREIDQALAAGLPNGATPPEGETAQGRYLRMLQGDANRRAQTKDNVHSILQGNISDFTASRTPRDAA